MSESDERLSTFDIGTPMDEEFVSEEPVVEEPEETVTEEPVMEQPVPEEPEEPKAKANAEVEVSEDGIVVTVPLRRESDEQDWQFRNRKIALTFMARQITRTMLKETRIRDDRSFPDTYDEDRGVIVLRKSGPFDSGQVQALKETVDKALEKNA